MLSRMWPGHFTTLEIANFRKREREREREREKEKDIERETNDREKGVIMDCNYIN